MSFLMDLAYLAAGIGAAPLLLRKRHRTGKYKSGLVERFGMGNEPVPTPGAGPTLLLHCVSVGEVNSVQTLIQQLLAADPILRIVVTTGTDTGTDRAAKLFPPGPQQRVFPVRFPFDFSFAVERLLDRVRPDAIALVELETWPNFLEIASERRIPTAIINGRISERSFPRYQLIQPVIASMLRRIDWIGAQTDTIAHRFIALGASAANVAVIPTIKYDNALVAGHVSGQEALAAAMGLSPHHRLLVAGSTGPGEEEIILDAFLRLRSQHPAARLALVPRHPEVVPQVLAAIGAHQLRPVLRTQRPDAGPSAGDLASQDVFVLDTMGELRKLYALAFSVFVGRSLLKKGGGGSDMIEVAALAKPSCFGPYTANFAEVVELLLQSHVARQVLDAQTLAHVWSQWLGQPDQASEIGRQAQELIRQQQAAHATQRYVQQLLSMVNAPKIR